MKTRRKSKSRLNPQEISTQKSDHRVFLTMSTDERWWSIFPSNHSLYLRSLAIDFRSFDRYFPSWSTETPRSRVRATLSWISRLHLQNGTEKRSSPWKIIWRRENGFPIAIRSSSDEFSAWRSPFERRVDRCVLFSFIGQWFASSEVPREWIVFFSGLMIALVFVIYFHHNSLLSLRIWARSGKIGCKKI